jgi:hypothetical protein
MCELEREDAIWREVVTDLEDEFGGKSGEI